MTESERKAFLAERLTAIGGSDASSLFNIGWGCQRRLWYEKLEWPEDYSRKTTDIMEMGNVLEPFFGKLYAEKTGVQIVTDKRFLRMEGHPELAVHIDAWAMFDSGARRGVAEIKSIGRGAWFKYKREGLPEDYVLQLQHGMGVTGVRDGVFIIGCRDNAELLHFEVPFNEYVFEEIAFAGIAFWKNLKSSKSGGVAPDRLEPEDSRCANCAYRTTCQGENIVSIAKASDYELDDAILPLVLEREQRGLLMKEAKELFDETNEELKTVLGERGLTRTNRGDKVQYYTIHKESYTVPAHDERPLRVYYAKEKK